jgi:Tfp pilus assembly protein PilF
VGASDRLENLLARGEDNATLRFALGSEYLKQDRPDLAIGHLSVAVTLDPSYSAAWKLLGKAQAQAGLLQEAKETYEHGISVARQRGDEQAAREMQVFLRRLQTGS